MPSSIGDVREELRQIIREIEQEYQILFAIYINLCNYDVKLSIVWNRHPKTNAMTLHRAFVSSRHAANSAEKAVEALKYAAGFLKTYEANL